MIFKPMLTLEQVKSIIRPQFEHLAKSTGEALWIHSFNVWAILSKFLFFIPRFDDKEKRLIEIAALIHDIGKMRDYNQEILVGKKSGIVKHTATKEEITSYLKPLIEEGILQLHEEDFNAIWQFTLHHYLSEQQLKEANIPSFGIYAEIVRYADWLSSMQKIDLLKVSQIKNDLQGICDLSVFTIGRFPSPSSYLICEVATKNYRSLGWIPLLMLDDGILFIGPKGNLLPNKNKIISEFIKELQTRTYEGHKIKVGYIRNEILAGKAKEDPVSFLVYFEDKIKDLLSDSSNAPVVFLKLLIELYKHSNKLNELRKQSRIIDLLIKAGSTSGITKAREQWISWLKDTHKIKGKNEIKAKHDELTEMRVNDFIKEIFEKINVSDVYMEKDIDNKQLTSMNEEELFNILLNIAQKNFSKSDDKNLKEILGNLIIMEEKTDFSYIAKETFKRYKQYKKTRGPESALCEHCGLPLAVKASPALNFPSHTGFTQINPIPESYAPRIVCPLCIYDVSTFYSTNSKSDIYARISVRVPEVWQFYPNLKEFIQHIRSALENIYEIKTLKSSQFSRLPLPSSFEIPLPKTITKQKSSDEEIPLHTEKGLFFPLQTERKESLKNLRSKYLSLYSLLNLLGFEVHIGKIEQEGLLGANIFKLTAIPWEDLYYKGLVISILAYASRNKKKKNRFVYAENILESSPSISLSLLENSKLKPEIIGKVISFLGKIKLNLF